MAERRAPGRPRASLAPPDPVDAQTLARLNAQAIIAKLTKKLDARDAEAKLRDFVRLAWPVIEPGSQFVPGWHIDAVCEHLEACSRREIRDLVITLPPRCAKSTLVNVCWPAWEWIRKPESRWIFLSHSHDLTIRDSLRERRLLESQWYRERWGSRFRLVDDENTQEKYVTDKGGWRNAMTPKSITGEGGDYLIYDDPHSVEEVESDSVRKGVIATFRQAISGRYRDPKTFVRVVTMQRLHEMDLAGYLIELGWDHLDVPMEYDGPRRTTSIGWTDPRTQNGELMWPARIDEATVAREKKDKGPRGYSAQFQQRPSPAGGGTFKRWQWRYWRKEKTDDYPGDSTRPVEFRDESNEQKQIDPVLLPERFEQVINSWDLAFKETENSDFVAGHVWGRIGANFYLIARTHARMDFPASLAAVRKMATEYPCPAKLIEDKANGSAVISTLRNEIPGIRAINPDGGKESRANAVSPYVASGNVYLPTPWSHPWVAQFIEEAANFPAAAHDDDVDAMTQALRYLSDSIALSAVPEFRVSPRIGEGAVSHVVEDLRLDPFSRRFIALSVGQKSAALWFCHTETGGIRVYRELDLTGVDAFEAGRRIAAATLPDAVERMRLERAPTWKFDIWLESDAFRKIDAGGSLAELIEHGIANFEPDDKIWERRVEQQVAMERAKLRCDMLEESVDASWQRLRDLMRISPPEKADAIWDVKKAKHLSRTDHEAYWRYMDAVNGVEEKEYPKIRFSGCPQLCAAIGSARVDEKESARSPFISALLLGISVPVEPESKFVEPVNRFRAQGSGNMPRRFRNLGVGGR